MFSARLARYVQNLVQDLASRARKILARFTYFLQDGFYWKLYCLARNMKVLQVFFLQDLQDLAYILQDLL